MRPEACHRLSGEGYEADELVYYLRVPDATFVGQMLKEGDAAREDYSLLLLQVLLTKLRTSPHYRAQKQKRLPVHSRCPPRHRCSSADLEPLVLAEKPMCGPPFGADSRPPPTNTPCSIRTE